MEQREEQVEKDRIGGNNLTGTANIPPSLRFGCLLTAELTHCLESWTQPGNGYPRPVRTIKTLSFCTTIELPETEGRKVWRRKPECEKSEICGREASGPHFGPIRTETPPAFYSPRCRASAIVQASHVGQSTLTAADHVHHRKSTETFVQADFLSALNSKGQSNAQTSNQGFPSIVNPTLTIRPAQHSFQTLSSAMFDVRGQQNDPRAYLGQKREAKQKSTSLNLRTRTKTMELVLHKKKIDSSWVIHCRTAGFTTSRPALRHKRRDHNSISNHLATPFSVAQTTLFNGQPESPLDPRHSPPDIPKLEHALWVAAAWTLGIEAYRRADTFRWFSVQPCFILILPAPVSLYPPELVPRLYYNLGVCGLCVGCVFAQTVGFCALPLASPPPQMQNHRNHTPSPCHPLIDQQGSRMLQWDLCPEPELTKTLPSGLEMRGVTTPDRLLARLLGGL
ncbi:uncharacterized protein CLUP02_08829 [Colletotrichum lupini]|uniref:Uncharacterized protein n=1 Tax=Colletotrichum lupini TaxID=145971 RepID=A0A9Q8WH87_9PEZI|nr:uncharacterized protein CLUP02_08829 [Colletotrichum lupini]UQC83334.1 hypothetical protein CLUP02_08829 [Colletotrichum lupini]